jgi:hypothetical protein
LCFLLVPCLCYTLPLEMEAVGSSETSFKFYLPSLRYIREDVSVRIRMVLLTEACRKSKRKEIRFEVLTAVVTKFSIFWDIAPCSTYMSRRFGGTYHFCLDTCPRWFLVRLIFDPEDGDDTFLQNVGSCTYYTALYPRRWHFSKQSNFCGSVP